MPLRVAYPESRGSSRPVVDPGGSDGGHDGVASRQRCRADMHCTGSHFHDKELLSFEQYSFVYVLLSIYMQRSFAIDLSQYPNQEWNLDNCLQDGKII